MYSDASWVSSKSNNMAVTRYFALALILVCPPGIRSMFPHYILSLGRNDAGGEIDNGLIRSYYELGFSYMEILLFLPFSWNKFKPATN